jgi:hypothetical protein
MKLFGKTVPYSFFVVLLLSLLSCAESIITMRDLTALRIGMSPTEIPKIMGSPPKEVFQWSLLTTGDSTIVQFYVLAFGEYCSTYFLAYRNDALIFWGYPQKFARSPDPLLREIGKGAIRRHMR